MSSLAINSSSPKYIQAQAGISYKLEAGATPTRNGNDLIVTLPDGEEIIIEGFYLVHDDSDIMVQDIPSEIVNVPEIKMVSDANQASSSNGSHYSPKPVEVIAQSELTYNISSIEIESSVPMDRKDSTTDMSRMQNGIYHILPNIDTGSGRNAYQQSMTDDSPEIAITENTVPDLTPSANMENANGTNVMNIQTGHEEPSQSELPSPFALQQLNYTKAMTDISVQESAFTNGVPSGTLGKWDWRCGVIESSFVVEHTDATVQFQTISIVGKSRETGKTYTLNHTFGGADWTYNALYTAKHDEISGFDDGNTPDGWFGNGGLDIGIVLSGKTLTVNFQYYLVKAFENDTWDFDVIIDGLENEKMSFDIVFGGGSALPEPAPIEPDPVVPPAGDNLVYKQAMGDISVQESAFKNGVPTGTLGKWDWGYGLIESSFVVEHTDAAVQFQTISIVGKSRETGQTYTLHHTFGGADWTYNALYTAKHDEISGFDTGNTPDGWFGNGGLDIGIVLSGKTLTVNFQYYLVKAFENDTWDFDVIIDGLENEKMSFDIVFGGGSALPEPEPAPIEPDPVVPVEKHLVLTDQAESFNFNNVHIKHADNKWGLYQQTGSFTIKYSDDSALDHISIKGVSSSGETIFEFAGIKPADGTSAWYFAKDGNLFQGYEPSLYFNGGGLDITITRTGNSYKVDYTYYQENTALDETVTISATVDDRLDESVSFNVIFGDGIPDPAPVEKHLEITDPAESFQIDNSQLKQADNKDGLARQNGSFTIKYSDDSAPDHITLKGVSSSGEVVFEFAGTRPADGSPVYYFADDNGKDGNLFQGSESSLYFNGGGLDITVHKIGNSYKVDYVYYQKNEALDETIRIEAVVDDRVDEKASFEIVFGDGNPDPVTPPEPEPILPPQVKTTVIDTGDGKLIITCSPEYDINDIDYLDHLAYKLDYKFILNEDTPDNAQNTHHVEISCNGGTASKFNVSYDTSVKAHAGDNRDALEISNPASLYFSGQHLAKFDYVQEWGVDYRTTDPISHTINFSNGNEMVKSATIVGRNSSGQIIFERTLDFTPNMAPGTEEGDPDYSGLKEYDHSTAEKLANGQYIYTPANKLGNGYFVLDWYGSENGGQYLKYSYELVETVNENENYTFTIIPDGREDKSETFNIVVKQDDSQYSGVTAGNAQSLNLTSDIFQDSGQVQFTSFDASPAEFYISVNGGPKQAIPMFGDEGGTITLDNGVALNIYSLLNREPGKDASYFEYYDYLIEYEYLLDRNVLAKDFAKIYDIEISCGDVSKNFNINLDYHEADSNSYHISEINSIFVNQTNTYAEALFKVVDANGNPVFVNNKDFSNITITCESSKEVLFSKKLTYYDDDYTLFAKDIGSGIFTIYYNDTGDDGTTQFFYSYELLNPKKITNETYRFILTYGDNFGDYSSKFVLNINADVPHGIYSDIPKSLILPDGKASSFNYYIYDYDPQNPDAQFSITIDGEKHVLFERDMINLQNPNAPVVQKPDPLPETPAPNPSTPDPDPIPTKPDFTLADDNFTSEWAVGEKYTFNALLNDVFVNDDSYVVEWIKTDSQYGIFSTPGHGVIEYTATAKPDTDAWSETFTYRVTNSHGVTKTADVVIRFTKIPDNPPPVEPEIPDIESGDFTLNPDEGSGHWNTGFMIQGNVLENDYLSNLNGEYTFEWIDSTAKYGMFFVDASLDGEGMQGTWVYYLEADAVMENAIETFRYRVTDVLGNHRTATLTINLTEYVPDGETEKSDGDDIKGSIGDTIYVDIADGIETSLIRGVEVSQGARTGEMFQKFVLEDSVDHMGNPVVFDNIVLVSCNGDWTNVTTPPSNHGSYVSVSGKYGIMYYGKCYYDFKTGEIISDPYMRSPQFFYVANDGETGQDNFKICLEENGHIIKINPVTFHVTPPLGLGYDVSENDINVPCVNAANDAESGLGGHHHHRGGDCIKENIQLNYKDYTFNDYLEVLKQYKNETSGATNISQCEIISGLKNGAEDRTYSWDKADPQTIDNQTKSLTFSAEAPQINPRFGFIYKGDFITSNDPRWAEAQASLWVSDSDCGHFIIEGDGSVKFIMTKAFNHADNMGVINGKIMINTPEGDAIIIKASVNVADSVPVSEIGYQETIIISIPEDSAYYNWQTGKCQESNPGHLDMSLPISFGADGFSGIIQITGKNGNGISARGYELRDDQTDKLFGYFSFEGDMSNLQNSALKVTSAGNGIAGVSTYKFAYLDNDGDKIEQTVKFSHDGAIIADPDSGDTNPPMSGLSQFSIPISVNEKDFVHLGKNGKLTLEEPVRGLIPIKSLPGITGIFINGHDIADGKPFTVTINGGEIIFIYKAGEYNSDIAQYNPEKYGSIHYTYTPQAAKHGSGVLDAVVTERINITVKDFEDKTTIHKMEISITDDVPEITARNIDILAGDVKEIDFNIDFNGDGPASIKAVQWFAGEKELKTEKYNGYVKIYAENGCLYYGQCVQNSKGEIVPQAGKENLFFVADKLVRGTDTITVRATDSDGDSVDKTFSVNVLYNTVGTELADEADIALGRMVKLEGYTIERVISAPTYGKLVSGDHNSWYYQLTTPVTHDQPGRDIKENCDSFMAEVRNNKGEVFQTVIGIDIRDDVPSVIENGLLRQVWIRAVDSDKDSLCKSVLIGKDFIDNTNMQPHSEGYQGYYWYEADKELGSWHEGHIIKRVSNHCDYTHAHNDIRDYDINMVENLQPRWIGSDLNVIFDESGILEATIGERNLAFDIVIPKIGKDDVVLVETTMADGTTQVAYELKHDVFAGKTFSNGMTWHPDKGAHGQLWFNDPNLSYYDPTTGLKITYLYIEPKGLTDGNKMFTWTLAKSIELDKSIEHVKGTSTNEDVLAGTMIEKLTSANGHVSETHFELHIWDDVPSIMVDGANINASVGADNGAGSKIEVSYDESGDKIIAWINTRGEIITDISGMEVGQVWIEQNDSSTKIQATMTKDGLKFNLVNVVDSYSENIIEVNADTYNAITGNIFQFVDVGADKEGMKITWIEPDEESARYGTFTSYADGSWHFIPNFEATSKLLNGQFKVISFYCNIVDGDGDTAVVDLKFNIIGREDSEYSLMAKLTENHEAHADDSSIVTSVEGSIVGGIANKGFNTQFVNWFKKADSGKIIITDEVIAGNYGDLTVNAAGEWTYKVKYNEYVTDLKYGQTLVDHFYYTVKCESGAMKSGVLDVVVESEDHGVCFNDNGIPQALEIYEKYMPEYKDPDTGIVYSGSETNYDAWEKSRTGSFTINAKDILKSFYIECNGETKQIKLDGMYTNMKVGEGILRACYSNGTVLYDYVLNKGMDHGFRDSISYDITFTAIDKDGDSNSLTVPITIYDDKPMVLKRVWNSDGTFKDTINGYDEPMKFTVYAFTENKDSDKRFDIYNTGTLILKVPADGGMLIWHDSPNGEMSLVENPGLSIQKWNSDLGRFDGVYQEVLSLKGKYGTLYSSPESRTSLSWIYRVDPQTQNTMKKDEILMEEFKYTIIDSDGSSIDNSLKFELKGGDHIVYLKNTTLKIDEKYLFGGTEYDGSGRFISQFDSSGNFITKGKIFSGSFLAWAPNGFSKLEVVNYTWRYDGNDYERWDLATRYDLLSGPQTIFIDNGGNFKDILYMWYKTDEYGKGRIYYEYVVYGGARYDKTLTIYGEDTDGYKSWQRNNFNIEFIDDTIKARDINKNILHEHSAELNLSQMYNGADPINTFDIIEAESSNYFNDPEIGLIGKWTGLYGTAWFYYKQGHFIYVPFDSLNKNQDYVESLKFKVTDRNWDESIGSINIHINQTGIMFSNQISMDDLIGNWYSEDRINVSEKDLFVHAGEAGFEQKKSISDTIMSSNALESLSISCDGETRTFNVNTASSTTLDLTKDGLIYGTFTLEYKQDLKKYFCTFELKSAAPHDIDGVNTGDEINMQFTITATDNTNASVTKTCILNIRDDSVPSANTVVGHITTGDILISGNLLSMHPHNSFGYDGFGDVKWGSESVNGRYYTKYGYIEKGEAVGDWIYTLNNENYEIMNLKKDAVLYDQIAYEFIDKDFSSAEATLKIRIIGKNHGVDFGKIDDLTVYESKLGIGAQGVSIDENSFNVIAVDNIDRVKMEFAGQNLILHEGTKSRVVIDSGEMWAMLTKTDSVNAVVTYGFILKKEYNHNGANSASLDVKFIATDSDGNSNSVTGHVIVKDSGPTALDDNSTSWKLNFSINGEELAGNTHFEQSRSVLSNDKFGSDGFGKIKWCGTDLSSGNFDGQYGTLHANVDGTWSYDLNANAKNIEIGRIKFEQFKYAVVDGDGSESTATLGILVERVGGSSSVKSRILFLEEDEFVAPASNMTESAFAINDLYLEEASLELPEHKQYALCDNIEEPPVIEYSMATQLFETEAMSEIAAGF